MRSASINRYTQKKKPRRYTQRCARLSSLECCKHRQPGQAEDSRVLPLTDHIFLHPSRDHLLIRRAKSSWNKPNCSPATSFTGLSACVLQRRNIAVVPPAEGS